MNFKNFIETVDWRQAREGLIRVQELLNSLANTFVYRQTDDGLTAQDMFDIDVEDNKPKVVGIKIPIDKLREIMVQYANVSPDAAPRMAAMAMQATQNQINWDEDDPRAAPDAFRFISPEDERY